MESQQVMSVLQGADEEEQSNIEDSLMESQQVMSVLQEAEPNTVRFDITSLVDDKSDEDME